MVSGIRADHHTIQEWLDLVKTGSVQLPEFQRDFVWKYKKVEMFLNAVLQGRPVGCLLLLKIDSQGDLPLEPRPIEGTDDSPDTVCEYLILDGQQRITALWRALMDYDDDRRYFIRFENTESQFCKVESRPKSQTWQEEPKQCLQKELIPIRLLRFPPTHQDNVTDWVDKAFADEEGAATLDTVRSLERWIGKYSERLRTFEIPFLSMPKETTEQDAIETFIETNTSSQSLRQFDIVAAEMLLQKKSKLRDARQRAWEEIDGLQKYLGKASVGDLLLKVACLRTGRLPVEKSYRQTAVWADITDNIDAIIEGVKWTIRLMHEDSIWDKRRLPSVVPLRVLPALHVHLPLGTREKAAAEKTARAYMWRAFLTDRYGSTAATLLREDYEGLCKVFLSRAEPAKAIPIWVAKLPAADNFLHLGWPTRIAAQPRAVLAIALRQGARDIGSGRKIRLDDLSGRQYHHIFPREYLAREAPGEEPNRALNCALISGRTNREAADKAPIEYFSSLAIKTMGTTITENDIRKRLESHLVPSKQLLQPVPVAKAYQEFLSERARLIAKHAHLLANGDDP